MSSITTRAAWEMADAVRKGKLSPVEVLEAHLAVIESQNPKLSFPPRRTAASRRRAGGGNAMTEVDTAPDAAAGCEPDYAPLPTRRSSLA